MSKAIHVYCDESRQTADRFMALGGIVLPASQVPVFNESMNNFRAEQRMSAELKWRKVSRGKLKEYKRFVEYFFALNNAGLASFRCLIIDTTNVAHARFGSDRETGFYKFYYQLLLHCFGKHCVANPENRLSVFLDYRNSPYPLSKLQACLNAGIKKRYGVDSAPFRQLEPRDSKDCDLIQIADILLGAVGFLRNGCHLIAGASPAKTELANYILSQSGLPSFEENTPREVWRFSVWNFRLQKKKAS